MTFEEIEELVTRGYEILNRYKYLFDASYASRTIPGMHDYESVLLSIRATLEQKDGEYKKLIERIEQAEARLHHRKLAE